MAERLSDEPADAMPRLQPQGPFSLLTTTEMPCVLEVGAAAQSGIYLFSIEHEGRDLVHYVGETGRSFAQRLREHLFAYLNGTYNVYEPEAFAAGQLDQIWEGMLSWSAGLRAGEFLARSDELMPAMRANLHRIRLWLLATDVDRRTRRLMETAIARHLMDQAAPIGTFHEPIKYEYRGPDEPSIEFAIDMHAQFIGMPPTLAT